MKKTSGPVKKKAAATPAKKKPAIRVDITVFRKSRDAVMAVNDAWELSFVNETAAVLFNKTPAQLTGVKLNSLFPGEKGSRMHQIMKEAKKINAYQFETEYYAPWNKWFEKHIYPVEEGLIVIFRDITDNRKSEVNLIKASRLYTFISQVNQLIIHAKDENTLFRELCEISVHTGQYKLAWVGLLNEASGRVEPLVFAGEEMGYLSSIKKINIKTAATGKGPTAMAIRSGESMVCHDIETDPRMKPWRAEALARGYHSSVSLPVRCNAKVIGSFSLYSGEKACFDEQEVTLLQEVVADISFTLTNFKLEKERIAAEEALKASEEKLRLIYDATSDVLFLLDVTDPEHMRFVSANKRFMLQTGLPDEAVIGQPVSTIIRSPAWELLRENALKAIQQQDKVEYEDVNEFPTGRRIGIISLTPATDVNACKNYLIGSVHDITEIRNYTEQLNRFNERFRLISQATNDALWEWNLNTGDLWANETHQQLYGLKAEDPVPAVEVWALHLHPDDRARILKQQEKYLASDDSIFITEYRFLKGNNDYRHILDRCFIIRDQNGKAVRMLGSMQDLTGLKQAEEELKLRGRQLQLLGDNLHGTMIFQLLREPDRKPRFTYVSREVEKFTGHKPSEVLENPAILYDLILPEDRPRLHEAEEVSYRSMEVFNVEIRSFNVQGEIRWLNIRSSPRRIGDGKVIWDGVHVDITDQKLIQERLRKEKELSDSIINSLPGIFYLYNIDGRFYRWNANFEKVSGYSAEEISSMHPLQFFAQEEKEILETKIRSVFEKGEDFVEADFLQKSGKKIPYFFTGRRIDYHGENCLMGVGIDITDRKRAQEELSQLNQQLRQLASHLQVVREEERKRIGREIHDELGQQLTAIKMDVAWLEKRIPESEEKVRTKLTDMISLLDGSNLAIRKILSELRIGLLEHQELEDAMKWYAKQYADHSGISISIDTPGDLQLKSEAVTSCLFRVFQESLTNISRYAGQCEVKIRMLRKNQGIMFEIVDNGKGFDPELLKKPGIFGILGMKERVMALQGSFELDTAPGKGTRIRVFIPLTDENSKSDS